MQRTFFSQGPQVAVPARRLVVSAKKGFGDAGGAGSKDQMKVSKRGKVASRPSPKKQLEKLQAEEREYQAAFNARLEAREKEGIAAAVTPLLRTPSSSPESSSSPEEDPVVPEQITDRMLQRMLMFSLGPVILGAGTFGLFYYLKKVQGIDLPVWVAYITSSMLFGGGLLGISYGILSSSWDQRREGSALGWNEFQANLPIVLDRNKKDS